MSASTPAAGRASTPRPCEGTAAGEGQVDLRAQSVRYRDPADPQGELVSVPFEIDPEIRRRLLEGLDDIALTLAQAGAIDSYEAERERRSPRVPVTTAL